MADLITLQEYKDLQGLVNPKDDYKLTQFIAAVSQLVKTYCGNSIIDFYSTNKVETFTLDWGTHIVQLTESPANTLVSVQKRETVDTTYETLNASDYYLDTPTDSVLYVSGSSYRNWPTGAGSVKITYTAGYSETPADLKMAVNDLVTYYLKDEHKVRRSLQGATLENSPGGEGRGFPDHIKRVLDLYKTF